MNFIDLGEYAKLAPGKEKEKEEEEFFYGEAEEGFYPVPGLSGSLVFLGEIMIGTIESFFVCGGQNTPRHIFRIIPIDNQRLIFSNIVKEEEEEEDRSDEDRERMGIASTNFRISFNQMKNIMGDKNKKDKEE